MGRSGRAGLLLAAILGGAVAVGPASAQAPAVTAARCNDGSIYTGASPGNACVGHGGVQDQGAQPPVGAPAPGTAAAAPLTGTEGDSARSPRR